MALPCVCYKCARCMTQESLKDPQCLSVEEENCEQRNCISCDFTCSRFTEKMELKRSSKMQNFIEI